MRRVVLLFNQSNTFGLSQDATLLETALKHIGSEEFEFVRQDPLQPPSAADIVIHLEVPHPVWIQWAPIQIWMVNPEWCVPAWDSYKELFTEIWVKEESRVKDFSSKAVHIPWCIRGPLKPIESATVKPIASATLKPIQSLDNETKGALWVLGGSINKHIAASRLLPLWPSDCPVTVTTALTEADLSGNFPASVSIKRGFLESIEMEQLALQSPLHIAISAAEGFGFTAAQAEARGASLLINTIPVYEETFGGKKYATFLKTPVNAIKEHCGLVADLSGITTADIQGAYQHALSPDRFGGKDAIGCSEDRYNRFLALVSDRILQRLKKLKKVKPQLPPGLLPENCPPISVLTVTYNRRNFIDLAFVNILTTDYPRDKIQWVIVDDSDDPNKMILDKIKKFEDRAPGCEITYVPMTKKRAVGYKRNKAVAAAKHSICLHMDDDDVYPETSFRRRVAWLLNDPNTDVVGCTMIAMYDLRQGISAVNVPPWVLEQRQRVSEASFCFYTEYAKKHPFPDVGSCEGEHFVPSCKTFVEIPPQQILVALNHGTNTSTRIIAGRAQTGCFWGWPPQFIKWLHGLVGVEVEDA
jgi:hypothetical protein